MKRQAVFTTLLLIVTAIGILSYALAPDKSVKIKNRASETEIAQLSTQLLEAATANTAISDPTQQTKLEAIATQRRLLMISAARDNPDVFLNNALSTQEQEQIPTSLKEKELIEQTKEIKGIYAKQHYDDLKNKKTRYYDSIQVNEDNRIKTFHLNIVGSIPSNLREGTPIAVQGYQFAGDVVVPAQNVKAGGGAIPTDGPFPTVTIPSPIPTPPTTGTIRTAVILVNFSNNSSQPFTKQEIKDRYFNLNNPNSLASHYKYISNNKVTFTGDVYGWYTSSITKESVWLLHLIMADDANKAALAEGIDVNTYDKISYVFPPSPTGYSGWAYVHGKDSYINGNALTGGTIEHEFGHNLGLEHASFLDCRNSQITNNPLVTCSIDEYGDVYDIMGTSSFLNAFGGANQLYLGWLPQSNVQTITSDVTTTISTLEQPTSNKQIIKIPRSDNYDYYIEYRQPTRFNSYDSRGMVDGTNIKLRSKDFEIPGHTFLVDTNPDGRYNTADSPLTDGTSFYDLENNITVTQVSHSDSSAILRISFAPIIITPNPSFTPFPSKQPTGPVATTSPTPQIPTDIPGGCPTQKDGDYNCDGKIDLIDFAIWKDGFLEKNK